VRITIKIIDFYFPSIFLSSLKKVRITIKIIDFYFPSKNEDQQ